MEDPLVGEVLKEDKELRQAQQHADDLRSKEKENFKRNWNYDVSRKKRRS